MGGTRGCETRYSDKLEGARLPPSGSVKRQILDRQRTSALPESINRSIGYLEVRYDFQRLGIRQVKSEGYQKDGPNGLE